MALDPILEKEFKKFDINEEIKGKACKYLSKDEKFQIVLDFFKEKKIPSKTMTSNSMERLISYTFNTKNEAKKFADSPVVGLLAHGRKMMADMNKDYNEYDVAFNISVMHDEKGNNPTLVTVRVL